MGEKIPVLKSFKIFYAVFLSNRNVRRRCASESRKVIQMIWNVAWNMICFKVLFEILNT